MQFKTSVLLSTLAALTAVNVEAQAFANAGALAQALGLPQADDAGYGCHASCGYAILAARTCSPNGDSDSDYNHSCLCENNTQFISLVPECLECGWCLWTDYGVFLSSALAECSYETTPTGTECIELKTSWLALEGDGTVASVASAGASYASIYASQMSSSSRATTRASTGTATSSSASTSVSTASESESQSSTGGAAAYAVGAGSLLAALGALLI